MVAPQKIDGPGFRVSTGAIQFGNDWPGIFIRGDEATGMADLLRAVANHPTSEVRRQYPHHLASLLESCREA